ncbi:MAG: proton-conducting membrane transporter, partial [Clostridiales bacterium]|nr:proton-conducting membrane transporter [Clostridiales bacterium]
MSPYFILVPILLPILAGVLLMTFPIQDGKTRAIAVESVVILNSILVLVLLLNRPAERLYLFSFVEDLPLTLNIDGMATFFGGLVAFLWPLATLYTFEYMHPEERVNTILS